MDKQDIAVVGLAVMGQNLILNMADHGHKVVAYNRTVAKVDAFLAGPAQGKSIVGAHSVSEMVALLEKPRRVMLMVKAGAVVDEWIELIAPHLEAGDIIIDGGNSLYTDTADRAARLTARGIHYLGVGISGGEEGARNGPSIMPGGDAAAWPVVKDIFQSIAAKTGRGEPCCDWVGAGGAGHFVKMVHNGIEYGDMQLIGEAWHLLRAVGKVDDPGMVDVFEGWNRGELSSYLIEITVDILKRREPDGSLLVDHILDAAGQKGTGKWTVNNALEFGSPLTLITEAVFARGLSALKDERVKASGLVAENTIQASLAASFIDDVRDALLAAKIISYAQGFMLMRQASHEFAWTLDFGNVAMLWRGGCIIRSVFLERIRDAFRARLDLESLLMDPWFADVLQRCQPGWRRTVATAALYGIPLPAMASALAFFDGYRTAVLPAKLLQAQRDYFGAHTYERTDSPRGQFFHTDWIGSGGFAQSGSYSA
jgi:6-phosphogluconate dehydrogenase